MESKSIGEKHIRDKEYDCKWCKITWLISTFSLIIAIYCIFITARVNNQLNEQKIKFLEVEDELVTVKSFITRSGQKSNISNVGKDTSFQTKSRTKKSVSLPEAKKQSMGSLKKPKRRLLRSFGGCPIACFADKGEPGKTGPPGPKGNEGMSGPMGPAGWKGKKGDPGEDGNDGQKGDAGQRGLKGDRGYEGQPGPIGSVGLKGGKGDPGEDGHDGRKGDAGHRGPQGDRGYKGQPGPIGPVGLKGGKGDPGEDGHDGRKGDAGLRGPKGDRGYKGQPGPIGPVGLKGGKGDSGEDGHDGRKGDAGQRGPKGDRGHKGQPGPIGPVGLKGGKGDPGEDGNDGKNGPRGLKGNRGDIGLPGPRGPAGLKGKKGQTGPRGPPGLSIEKARITSKPSDVTVNEGSTAIFTCEATGYPKPDLSWFLNKKKVKSSMKNVKVFGNIGLEIQNVSVRDNGPVTCIAKNVIGKDKASSKLVVLKVKYKDCKDAFLAGKRENGIYTIRMSDGKSLKVYCDMKTDGGGWTVFQRRIDASVDFYRGWDEYKRGFGDLNGNFWLGLDNIHRLTAAETSLRIDMKDLQGSIGFAKYNKFKIGSEQKKYKLEVAGFSGNAKDSLLYHNNRPFSTKDRDSDRFRGNCAVAYRGAWWYKNCHNSNLNGLHPRKGGSGSPMGMSWYQWTKRNGTIKSSEMKLRRLT